MKGLFYELILPNEETEELIHEYLSSFCLEDAPKEGKNNYLRESFRRFLYTLSIIPKGKGKLLEIGANPYFMTLLLKRFTECDIHCSNFIGYELPEESAQFLTNEKNERFEIKFHNFNIEDEAITYGEKTFDVILFCEVIEHLTKDPLRALLNIKKMLKPNGYLLLTTPNVSRLENVIKMIAGINIYDPYSGYGVYGRHNREYHRHELNILLRHAGFEIEVMFASDVHRTANYNLLKRPAIWLIKACTGLLKNRKFDLGQYIFVRAKNVREAGTKKHKWLYRSYAPEELCD